MNVLVIAEHDHTKLNAATAKTVACAMIIGEVSIAVFSHAPDAVAAQAAKLDGVDHVLTIARSENEHQLAATLAPQIEKMAEDYDVILMPSTTFGKDVLARVAGHLQLPQVSDIMEVVGDRRFKRPIYAGNVIVTVEVPVDTKIIGTVRTASFQAVEEAGGADIEARSTNAELPTHTRFVGLEAEKKERPDLQSAERVVSGGRALGSEENFKLIYDLADKLNAAAGASRAAVDAGYVPNDMQVGQTGKIIAPDLYIAIGISGAIQHVTGIKDAGTIVAINKDPEAAIFKIADFGLVGDLFKIIPELEKAIESL